MHTAAYRALGLDYVYVAFGTEDTEGAVAAMRALGLRGLGVTRPHKVRIIDYLDVIDDDARAIGAVNTVVNDDGRLTGHNVDWQGAFAALHEVIDPAGRRAAVVGAGGGARAIAYGLEREGALVTLFNRSHAIGRSPRPRRSVFTLPDRPKLSSPPTPSPSLSTPPPSASTPRMIV